MWHDLQGRNYLSLAKLRTGILMKKTTILFFAAMLLCGCGRAGTETLAVLSSPDGRLSMEFSLTDEGAPEYSPLSIRGGRLSCRADSDSNCAER